LQKGIQAMTKYKISFSIGFVGADREEEIDLDDLGYSESEWNKLSNSEKEEALHSYIDEWSINFIERSFKKIK
jgi:hypothetical protein